MKHREQDKDWSESVAYNAQGLCEICGNFGTDAHHLFKRRYLRTRWNRDNGTWLCRTHHIWAEANPKKFKKWFILTRGVETYQKLFELHSRVD
jgi:hypothetical protein